MTVYRKGDATDSGSKQAGRNDDGTLAPGTVLSTRYRVIGKLGEGGMGSVFEVHDDHLEEDVALKLLHPDLGDDLQYRQRLRSEVRLARRVSHPNVCRVHDLGEHEGQLFVTMELIRGLSLRSMLKAIRRELADPLPLPKKIDVVVQICSALSAAHRAGVLHRDVKPDNVILENERAVLTDFGVASLTADLAGTRMVAGTPSYIAPEVLRGERYDHRADVYACAIVAYELIAGRQPFKTPNLEAAMQRARTRPRIPALPRHAAADQPRRSLEEVLARGLHFEPKKRSRSVDRFAEELSQAARGIGSRPWGSSLTGEVSLQDTLPPQSLTTPTPQSLEALATPQSSSRSFATTTARSHVRVATALHFVCESAMTQALPTQSDSEEETRPLELGSPNDKLERIVVDMGGTPLHVTETSIVALFGAPVSLGDDAARAARAAHALLNATMDGRAGIDTARVLFRQTLEQTPSAAGEALSEAQSLATEAQVGEVRVSAAAARQLAGRFKVAELSHDLSATAGERALAVLPASASDLDQAGIDQPMLGRDQQLKRLDALMKDVCEQRSPRWIRVVGAAGYGKSRLRKALMRSVDERREIDWLLGRATPLGEVAPFSLLRSAHENWFQSTVRSGVHDRPAAFAAARVWLEKRAARRPVGILLEDVHWADDASLEFFSQLNDQLHAVPVAVIMFGRSEPNGEWLHYDPTQDTITLEALDDRYAIEIARGLAPAASPAELRDLAHRASGNPFFVEELARDLRERGNTVISQTTPLPATVEAVVQGRLDRLPPAAREVVYAAAVVGREFWREAARAALPSPDAVEDRQLDEVLAELEHRAIVAALPPTTVDDDRYVFHSALVRDVAYQQFAPRDRRLAHTAVAQWLEQRAGGLSTDDPLLLSAIAHHRDLAGDRAEACEAYRKAGKRSLQLFAYREAATALRRAQALAKEHDPELLELVGDAVVYAENIEAGADAYRRALAFTEEPTKRAILYQKLGGCATESADNQAAVDYLTKGLDILAPGGELTSHARAHPAVTASLLATLGWTLGYVMNDNQLGLLYSERAVSLLEDTPHRRELSRALSRLGANYMRAGRWLDQLRCNQRNLRIGEELGDLKMQLTGHINLGVTYTGMGEFRDGINHTRKALALCGRTNSMTTIGLVRSNLAGLLLEVGELDEAERHLKEAISIANNASNRRYLAEAHTFAARIRAKQKDLEGAEDKARQAVALSQDKGDLTLDEGVSLRILAAVLALRGRYAEAEALLERSHRCLAEHDPFEDARTTAAQAKLFALRDRDGDQPRSEALIADARAVFERLGAKGDLAELNDLDSVR